MLVGSVHLTQQQERPALCRGKAMMHEDHFNYIRILKQGATTFQLHPLVGHLLDVGRGAFIWPRCGGRGLASRQESLRLLFISLAPPQTHSKKS